MLSTALVSIQTTESFQTDALATAENGRLPSSRRLDTAYFQNLFPRPVGIAKESHAEEPPPGQPRLGPLSS